MNIFSQVNKRESVLSANPQGTALAFSHVPSQIQKLNQKENELLTKIENEIFRRQQFNQLNQTFSPPWNGKVGGDSLMGPFSSLTASSTAKQR